MTPADTRRLMHASTAVVLAGPPLWGWPAVRLGLAVALAGWSAVEIARLRWPAVGRFLVQAVPVFRPAEARRLSGAWWLLATYAVLSWLPAPAAGAGILVAAGADPAASWAGSRWGTPRGVRGKSWTGTVTAAVVAALLLGWVDLGWSARIGAALGAAAAERWPGPLDDNATVGPVAAVMVLWLG